MRTLAGTDLVPASVARTATLADAANELIERDVSLVAVVDEENRVVGLFGGEELLRGLFPRYLGELHHTAFATDDAASLLARASEARGERVETHMREPVTVEVDSSATHAAERFLHCGLPALAAVEGGAFVGMLDRVAFSHSIFRAAASDGG